MFTSEQFLIGKNKLNLLVGGHRHCKVKLVRLTVPTNITEKRFKQRNSRCVVYLLPVLYIDMYLLRHRQRRILVNGSRVKPTL